MPKRLINELQRRKVLRVAGVYLVGAWIILQLADIVLPAFGWPETAVTVVLGILVVGFPIVMVLAWVFELTPEGVKLDAEVDRRTVTASSVGRRVDFAIIGLLLVALGYFAYGYFTRPAAGPSPGEFDSVAVLPFINMSADQENEYFSDGLSEELLNVLARVQGLKVAGRTSSFFFKGRNVDLKTIGEKLGVATILEGSVRKSGNSVRVTAQLIDANSGFHLWSENYDYELDDMFAVQDQIAQAVVTALKVQLLGEQGEALSRTYVPDTDAYTAYLRGRYELHKRLEESILTATDYFTEAAERDPDYALAWAGLAESYILQFTNHQLISGEEAIARADEAIGRALMLDDETGDIYAALGLIRYQAREFEAAEQAFTRALQLNPGYAEAWHWYGLLYIDLNQYQKAYEMLSKAVELDPLHRVARSNVGRALSLLGSLEEARAHYERGIELDPEFPVNYARLAGVVATQPMPRPDESIGWLQHTLRYAPDDPGYLSALAQIYMELGDLESARVSVARTEGARPGHPNAILARLVLLLYEGDDSGAVAFLEDTLESYGERLGEIAYVLHAVRYQLLEDPARANENWLKFQPHLDPDGPPVISITNYNFATLVAGNYVALGDSNRASILLDALEKVIDGLPRFGNGGFALTDVEILTLRGEPQAAIRRLRQALDEGYRRRLINGVWSLRQYPVFESLREDPEFRAMAAEIDAYVEGLHFR